ncbi:DPOLL polymerase, partial [Phaetusa simplex]|nr:DPOLL polymerase [Phaetusa simplex]
MEPQGIVKAFFFRKKVRDDSGKSIFFFIPKEEGTEISEDFFLPVTAYVLQAGIGFFLAEIFHKQIVQNGFFLRNQLSSEVTHVIFFLDMDCDRAFRLLNFFLLPSGLQLVKASCFFFCIRDQKLLSTAGFFFFIPRRYANGILSFFFTIFFSLSKAVYKASVRLFFSIRFCSKISDDEDSDFFFASVTQGDLEALIFFFYPVKSSEETSDSFFLVAQPASKWVCAHFFFSKKENHNQCITDFFLVLAKAYSVQGDNFFFLGYAKAINALKSYHKPVTSYQEACKIPGFFFRMAEKILEILESFFFRKLDHISESVPVLELFSNIWGAGVKTAFFFYQQGFRTLDDIRTKATLTSQQAVGLKHYTDFLERMPREEAAEIEQTVTALALKPGLVFFLCGSYRRGKPTCGFFFVLVTHPDGQSHRFFFSKLLDSLHRSG